MTVKGEDTELNHHHPILLTVIVFVLEGIGVYFAVSARGISFQIRLLVGSVILAGAVYAFNRPWVKKNAPKDIRWYAFWYLLTAIFSTLLAFLGNSGNLIWPKLAVAVDCLAIGMFEETVFRFIPLVPIFFFHARNRKTLMIGSSLIFGFAHVIATLPQAQPTFAYWGDFIGKGLSAALFGLLLSMVVVNLRLIGLISAIVVHALNDFLLSMTTSGNLDTTYITGSLFKPYMVEIAFTLFVFLFIELARYLKAVNKKPCCVFLRGYTTRIMLDSGMRTNVNC